MGNYRPITDELFWARVVTLANGCRVWTGAKTDDGYGQVHRLGKTWKAHRWAWFLKHGSVPPEIDHECNNRPCVEHLRAMTHSENVARTRRDRPSCGHVFDQVDRKNGRGYSARRCSVCRAEQVRAAKARYRERHAVV